jgi:hypothetical protein
MGGATLDLFLAENAVVTDAPAYGRRSRFSEEDLAEICRLRDEGQTMLSIAGRFVDESYICRLLRAKDGRELRTIFEISEKCPAPATPSHVR